MTTYGGKDLAAAFRTVRMNTIQIANDIPENKYDFKPAADARSVSELLVHIALATKFPLEFHGNGLADMSKVDFQELMAWTQAETARPRTKAEIVALLKTRGDAAASYLEGLDDAFLAETVAMMPGAQPATKTRFEMLLGVKEHEMHHRAQLMLIERMIGIVPHITRQMQERMARMQASSRS